MSIVNAAVIVLRAFLAPRAAIAAENLCLRQQLAVLHQSVRRPRLRQRDRVFWVWLSRLWTGCLKQRHLIAAERTHLIGRLRADLGTPPVRTP